MIRPPAPKDVVRSSNGARVKIVTVSRGNIGGGLAGLWSKAAPDRL
jgi:hypothetical protein